MAGRVRKWWRSAWTGRFVTKRFASRHPKQVVQETEKPKGKAAG